MHMLPKETSEMKKSLLTPSLAKLRQDTKAILLNYVMLSH